MRYKWQVIPIKFSKYHGTGNDFILMDNREQTFRPTQEEVAFLCRRHFGIGADGLMLVEPSDVASVKMVYYNSDGSAAAMCGNGIRCFAKFLWDKEILQEPTYDVETAAGIKTIRIMDHSDSTTSRIQVDMGPARYEPETIGIQVDHYPILDHTLETPRGDITFSALSMGNPHAVVLVEDVDRFSVSQWGPIIEKHSIFTHGANVNFTQVVDRDHCRVVTWERGAGQTLACGTGSCAAAAVLHKKGLIESKVTVQVPGGKLEIEIGETILMTGPAVWVFDGCIKEMREECL